MKCLLFLTLTCSIYLVVFTEALRSAFQVNVIVHNSRLQETALFKRRKLKKMVTFRAEHELVCSLHCHRRSWCKVSCLRPDNTCYLSDMFVSKSYKDQSTQNLALCATTWGDDLHRKIAKVYKTPRGYVSSNEALGAFDGIFPSHSRDFFMTFGGGNRFVTLDFGQSLVLNSIIVCSLIERYATNVSIYSSNTLLHGHVGQFSGYRVLGNYTSSCNVAFQFVPKFSERYLGMQVVMGGNWMISYLILT